LDEDGCPLAHFHLYDSSGCLAGESGGPRSFPDGLNVYSADGELLLYLPADLDADLRYRLYNQDGLLLTCSDGAITKIRPLLRMEAGSPKPSGIASRGAAHQTPPAPKAEAS
jgi:hypothetical protein